MNIFDKISLFFNRILDRFTFRGRFLLFSLIYIACVPFPFYWFIMDQNLYIKTSEVQIENWQKQRVLNNLLNDLVHYQIIYLFGNENSSSYLESYEKEILANLTAIQNQDILEVLEEQKDRENLYKKLQDSWEKISSDPLKDSSLLIKLQDDMIKEITRKIIANTANVKQSAISLYPEQDIVDTTLAFLSNIQAETGKVYILTKQLIKDPTNPYFNQRFYSHQHLLKNLIKDLKYYFLNTYNLYNFSSTHPNTSFKPISAINYLNKLHLWIDQPINRDSISSLNNLKNLLNQNKQLTEDLLSSGIHEMASHRYTHNFLLYACIALTAFASSVVLGCVIFHALTSHFLALNEHIIAFSKGKFKKCFCSNAKDEFGPVGIAFDKMAQTVQEVVTELQRLGRQLAESAKQISDTTIEQNLSFQTDERKIKDVEDYTKVIALRTQSLASSMNELTFNSEQNQLSIDAKNTLEKMGAKTLSLKSRSQEILRNLNTLKSSIEGNKKIFNFLAKISNQASLLSLNSAIESSNIVSNKQSFNKITQEIKRFSEKTAASNQDVQSIIKGLFKRIDVIYDNANNFFDELTLTTNRLRIVEKHLNIMTETITNQTDKFRPVNKIMQEQAKIVEEIRKSFDFIVKIAKENSSETTHLQESMQDLKFIANKLQYVLGLFFHPKQIKKLNEIKDEL